MDYTEHTTALLLVDPYNDFISEGGKVFDGVKQILAEENMLEHMRQIIALARKARIQLFIVPHHRAEPGDYAHWKYTTPRQDYAHQIQAFGLDTWGGTFHPDFQPQAGDVVVKEHFGSSGFVSTDLDYQLKERGLSKLILIGMLANTCIETTAKNGAELGYDITLVKDATGAFNRHEMDYAHKINGPTFARSILTTAALLDKLTASAAAAALVTPQAI